MMAQLDYMEKRGSGLTRICNETKALEGYKDELEPKFKSTPTQFQTIIFASSDTQKVGDENHCASAENHQSHQGVSDNNRPSNVGDVVGKPTYHRTRPLHFAKERFS